MVQRWWGYSVGKFQQCRLPQPCVSPVCLAGLTYDRPAIMKWIEQHRRDPTTSLKLKAHHLSPNLSLRTIIQTWVDMQS